MPNDTVHPKYRRAVLDRHAVGVVGKLIAVRVPFEYAPGLAAGSSFISVPAKHSATLDLCIRHALGGVDAESP